MLRSIKVRAVALAGMTVLVTASAALASATPTVPAASGTSGKGLKAKPSSIIYTGDGSAFLAGARKSASHTKALTWTSWSASSGKGSGYNWLNSCKPDCASGTFHSYPVTLKVWRPKTVAGQLIFTRMTVTYTSKLPPGARKKIQIWKVRYHHKAYVWKFPPQ